MSTEYRLIARNGQIVGEADSLDGIIEIAKKARSGRYRINKVWLDPSTGDLRTWSWGRLVKSRDGRIDLHLPPWMD
jgi:hypothetical protein